MGASTVDEHLYAQRDPYGNSGLRSHGILLISLLVVEGSHPVRFGRGQGTTSDQSTGDYQSTIQSQCIPMTICHRMLIYDHASLLSRGPSNTDYYYILYKTHVPTRDIEFSSSVSLAATPKSANFTTLYSHHLLIQYPSFVVRMLAPLMSLCTTPC